MIEKSVMNFNVGDSIEIVSGPFEGRTFEIASVNLDAEEVVVLVEMFGGRSTQMTFSFKQIRKL